MLQKGDPCPEEEDEEMGETPEGWPTSYSDLQLRNKRQGATQRQLETAAQWQWHRKGKSVLAVSLGLEKVAARAEARAESKAREREEEKRRSKSLPPPSS